GRVGLVLGLVERTLRRTRRVLRDRGEARVLLGVPALLEPIADRELDGEEDRDHHRDVDHHRHDARALLRKRPSRGDLDRRLRHGPVAAGAGLEQATARWRLVALGGTVARCFDGLGGAGTGHGAGADGFELAVVALTRVGGVGALLVVATALVRVGEDVPR